MCEIHHVSVKLPAADIKEVYTTQSVVRTEIQNNKMTFDS